MNDLFDTSNKFHIQQVWEMWGQTHLHGHLSCGTSQGSQQRGCLEPWFPAQEAASLVCMMRRLHLLGPFISHHFFPPCPSFIKQVLSATTGGIVLDKTALEGSHPSTCSPPTQSFCTQLAPSYALQPQTQNLCSHLKPLKPRVVQIPSHSLWDPTTPGLPHSRCFSLSSGRTSLPSSLPLQPGQLLL